MRIKLRHRRKLTLRQKQKAHLDELFSEYIRKRAIKEVGGCERCKTPKFDIQKDNGSIFPAYKLLDCAHFKPRGTYSTRWDESNAAGLCGGCHSYLDNHSTEKDEFFKNLLGEEEFALVNMQNQFNIKMDLAAVELYLKAKLREIDLLSGA